MIISVKKHQTHSSNQHKINRFQAKFAQKIPTKLAVLITDCLLAKLALKISANLSPEMPQKFDFFSTNYQKPVVWRDTLELIV